MDKFDTESYCQGYFDGHTIGRNEAVQEVVEMLDNIGRKDLSNMVLGIEEGEEFQHTLI